MQINITGGTMLTTLTLIILTLPGLCYYSKWVFHTSSSLFNPSHHLPLLASYFTKKREVEAPTTKDFHYHIHPCSSLLPACYCRLITTVSTWRNSVLECRIPSYSRMLLQYITMESNMYKCMGFPHGSVGKICLQCRRPGFDSWVGKTPWRRKWQSTPVFLPGKSHGERSLAGYSPWGCKSWTWLSD